MFHYDDNTLDAIGKLSVSTALELELRFITRASFIFDNKYNYLLRINTTHVIVVQSVTGNHSFVYIVDASTSEALKLHNSIIRNHIKPNSVNSFLFSKQTDAPQQQVSV